MQQQAVSYIDGDTTLQGQLYREESYEGKRPGVLILPELWGMSDYVLLRAEMLAELGYVTLAADLYGNKVVTSKPEVAANWQKKLLAAPDTGQRRAMLALKALKAHPNVDPKRLAIIGYSLGGNLALNMAYQGTDVKGVSVFHTDLQAPTPKQASGIKTRILIAQPGYNTSISAVMDDISRVMTTHEVDWELNIYGGAKGSFSNPYADAYGLNDLEYHESSNKRSWSRLLMFFEEIFDENFDALFEDEKI